MALRHAESCELLPFQFDTDKLLKFQEELPLDLHFLRLRLRFGLPAQVHIGQRIRLVVDLVDEMGQPVPETFAPPNGIDISITSFGDRINTTADHLVLKVEDTSIPERTKHRQTKWMYWVSIRGSISLSRVVQVNIQMKQEETKCDDSDNCRQLLQTFCAGSAWVTHKVLVLPLQVELQVTSAILEQEDDPVATSTRCQRVFCASRELNSEVKNERILVIEENYGDSMGSHVWDASILLSFVMLQAGITVSKQQVTTGKSKKLSMLELGSGCGFFATVLANFHSSGEITTIFTEKSECTARLQANLDRNCSPQSAIVTPLEWGTSLPNIFRAADVRVVFAADVLYNWAAHEVFLATLDSLIQNQESSASVQVFLAHKRRGKMSAAKLDALASETFDFKEHCGIANESSACRWTHWRIQKLASLGRIDLFKLNHAN